MPDTQLELETLDFLVAKKRLSQHLEQINPWHRVLFKGEVRSAWELRIDLQLNNERGRLLAHQVTQLSL